MIDAFRRLYGSADGIRVFRAPGRVNLIGEHTDYNQGFVLPVALEMATFVATAPSPDGKLRLYSEQHKELAAWPVEEIGTLRPQRHWTDYPIGVAQELLRAGMAIAPQDMLIRSTVPEGAGLSSSAALEVASALASLAKAVRMPPDILPADPVQLRAQLKGFTPAMAGITPGRWRNVWSLTSFALQRFGLCAIPRRFEHAPSPAWNTPTAAPGIPSWDHRANRPSTWLAPASGEVGLIYSYLHREFASHRPSLCSFAEGLSDYPVLTAKRV